MTPEEKIKARIHQVEHDLTVFIPLMASGNPFAEGYVLALKDQLRWLRWLQED